MAQKGDDSLVVIMHTHDPHHCNFKHEYAHNFISRVHMGNKSSKNCSVYSSQGHKYGDCSCRFRDLSHSFELSTTISDSSRNNEKQTLSPTVNGTCVLI